MQCFCNKKVHFHSVIPMTAKDQALIRSFAGDITPFVPPITIRAWTWEGQCPARVDIESSRSESEKNSLSLFVREVKSEMKI